MLFRCASISWSDHRHWETDSSLTISLFNSPFTVLYTIIFCPSVYLIICPSNRLILLQFHSFHLGRYPDILDWAVLQLQGGVPLCEVHHSFSCSPRHLLPVQLLHIGEEVTYLGWSGNIAVSLTRKLLNPNSADPKSCRINLFPLLSIYSGVFESVHKRVLLGQKLVTSQRQDYFVSGQAIPEIDVQSERWNSYQHQGLLVRNVETSTDWHMGGNGCCRILFWTDIIWKLTNETIALASEVQVAGAGVPHLSTASLFWVSHVVASFFLEELGVALPALPDHCRTHYSSIFFLSSSSSFFSTYFVTA